MTRFIIAALLLSVALCSDGFARSGSNPPGPQPITCGGGNSFTAYPGYGQAPTCGTALNTGTVNAGAAPQIGQYTASTTISPATVSGDATLAAGGALTVASIGGKAVTLGGAFTTSGAFATTFTMTAATGVTFPTTGTLATRAGAETLTNKTFDCANNTCTVRIGTDVSGLGTGVSTFLATPTSANLAAAITNETGSGALMFGTGPTASGLTLSDVATGTQCLHANSSGVVSGTGSDCGSGGGSVSVTAGTPNIVITPTPGTGTFTVGTTVPQNSPADGGSHSYTLLAGDLTKQVILASTFTAAAVPQATGSFAAGSAFSFWTKGAGTATSTTSTVNGIAGATGIKFGANQATEWASDGTNWLVALGVPQPATQTGTTFLRDDMTWAAPSGSGTVNSGTSGQLAYYAANGTAVSTNGESVAHTWTAAQTFTAAGPLVAGANGGNVGSLKLFGNTSGDATIVVPAAAGTATRFQLPATNGSNTNVLQTDGSGNTSWVAAGAGGGIGTKIALCTAASTTCNFNSLGSHAYYHGVCSGLTVSTSADVQLTVNSDSTSGHYAWALNNTISGTAGGAGSTSDTRVVLNGSVATTDTLDVDFWITNIASTTLHKMFRYTVAQFHTGQIINASGGGAFTQTGTAVTSIQVTTSAGTFGSGANQCTLYAYDA